MNIKMGWKSRRNPMESPQTSKLKPTSLGEALAKTPGGSERASTGEVRIKPIVRVVAVNRRGLTPGELQRTAGTENGAVPSIGTAPSSMLRQRHKFKRRTLNLGEITQLLLPQRAQHREPPARPQPPPGTAHERYRQPSGQPSQRQCDPAEPAEPQWLQTQPRCAA